MMHRFFSWPIRVHLTILIALLAVPSISLIVYSGIAARRQAIAGAKAECLKFVNDVAGRQQAIVAGAEQLGTALSLLPPIQSRNPAAVSAIFSEFLKKNPQYANIAVCDKNDLIWASAIPLEGKVSVADRRFVREAARTGMFSSGEYVVGRIAKKPVMSFGYPVKNTAHELIAVLRIVLDLDYSQHMFERLHLPPGSSFSLLDHQGIILIRSLDDPFSEKLLGKRDTREELFTRMTEGPDEGTYEAMGNDGRFRLVAYKRISLPHESKPYMYIRSSIPLASATRAANAAMFENLSVFASLFLFGLLLAWYIGRRVIVRPAMMLKGASEQLAAGADTVHVSHVVKGGELGEVARAFDGMAEALVQREAALRESEERWATTLASIGDAVIATDVAGKVAFMNAVAEDLTGWTIREASMKPVTEVFNIINEQTRGTVESPVARVLREGTVVGLANHTVLVRKDGTETPIDDSGAPIRDRDGNTMGVVLVFRDITERKQAEERTKHLASFPQLNPSPVIEVDAAGSMTFCNPGTFTILDDLGFGREGCEGFLPEDIGSILQNWDKKSESTLYREVRLKNRVFGETIHLVPQFHAARVYALDITERKQAEEKLLRAKEEWERTFASVPDMVAIIDDQYRVLAVNEAMARRLGRKVEECVGFRCYEAVHGLSEPPDFCPHSRTIKDGRQHIEQVHEDRLGGHFLVSTTPLHDEQGRMIGTVHVAHDITERKHLEEELRKSRDGLELRVHERTEELREAYEKLKEEIAQREQAEAQLRQAQKMEALGTLSGGIAHDFNNILAAIIGFTELVADHAAIGSRDARHLARVLEAGIRGRELVRQMLTFSRKTEQEKKPLRVSSIVKETVRLIRATTPTTISIRVTSLSESGLILGDPTQIQQVLMNLCTNAVCAMQEKGGTLDVELSAFSVQASDGDTHGIKPGVYMKLAVRDTGVGIAPEVMERIFDPFFTTKKLGEGTGLGLSVVHGIVKHSDGHITVESEPGKGSVFSVYFPKVSEEPETDVMSDEALPTGSERVLFVDDEEALVEMGEDILAELGYDVTSRLSSREALDLFRLDPSRFDLVITDQTMPEMTGVELAKEILAVRADTPIIMCTGFSHAVDADKAKAAGIRGFSMKPLTRKEIAGTIRKVLDEQ